MNPKSMFGRQARLVSQYSQHSVEEMFTMLPFAAPGPLPFTKAILGDQQTDTSENHALCVTPLSPEPGVDDAVYSVEPASVSEAVSRAVQAEAEAVQDAPVVPVAPAVKPAQRPEKRTAPKSKHRLTPGFQHPSAAQPAAPTPADSECHAARLVNAIRIRPRTHVLIDGEYLVRSAGVRLNFKAFREMLDALNDGPIEAVWFFGNDYTDHPGYSKFLGYLKFLGFRTELYGSKTMRCRCPDCGGAHDRQVQKGADVGFVSTALRGAYKNQYDRIILVAGDGDFTPMARMVACEEGKQIWIMGFEHTVSADLAGYCNNLIYLDSYKSALMRDAVEVPVA